MTDSLLITCEHGGNRVPARYRSLFRDQQKLLETHRGYDFGALLMAREMAASFSAPLVASTVTRLLIDLNRSIGHSDLHSKALRRATAETLLRIRADHYVPYRSEVEHLVSAAIGRGERVIHVSSHSFTPRLHGQTRSADIGLLYDPGRIGEVEICARWKAALRDIAPALRVRRNYPYEGKNDGLTLHLRRRHPPSSYVGIELEINQAFVVGERKAWTELRAAVIESLRTVVAANTAWSRVPDPPGRIMAHERRR